MAYWGCIHTLSPIVCIVHIVLLFVLIMVWNSLFTFWFHFFSRTNHCHFSCINPISSPLVFCDTFITLLCLPLLWMSLSLIHDDTESEPQCRHVSPWCSQSLKERCHCCVLFKSQGGAAVSCLGGKYTADHKAWILKSPLIAEVKRDRLSLLS